MGFHTTSLHANTETTIHLHLFVEVKVANANIITKSLSIHSANNEVVINIAEVVNDSVVVVDHSG
jgi:hypothetical protein